MRADFFLFLCFINSPFLIHAQALDTIIMAEGDTIPLTIDRGFDWLLRQHDDKIGQPAIPFDATDYNDLRHRSSDYMGKILIVYFWDVWSWDSCERQTGALNRIAKKHPDDVAIVSFVGEVIRLDERAFLQGHPVHFPIIPNSTEFGMAYHGYKSGIPVLFFIDGKGVWQKVVVDADMIEMTVEEMLGR